MKKFLILVLSVFTFFGCEEQRTDNIVISLLGAPVVYVPVNGDYSEPGFIANSSVDGDVSARVTVDDSKVDTSVPGTYTVGYQIRNRLGETVSASRIVKVTETTAFLRLEGDSLITVELLETFNDPGLTVVDVDGSDALSKVTVQSDYTNEVPGSYAIIYSFTDLLGVTHSATRTVNVVIPEEPIIILKGAGKTADNPLRLGQAKKQEDFFAASRKLDPGWTAYSRRYGDVSAFVTADYSQINFENVNLTPQTAVYTLTIGEGEEAQTATASRYVVIVDDALPPEITLYTDVRSSIAADASATFATLEEMEEDFDAEDDTSATVIKTVEVFSVDSLTNPTRQDPVSEADLPNILHNIGFYKVVYSAADDAGNTASVERLIEVYDATKPVLTVTLPQEVAAGEDGETTQIEWRPVALTSDFSFLQEVEYASAKTQLVSDVTASDESSSRNILKIEKTQTNDINMRVPGTYETVFYARDDAGNISYRFTRIVRILPPPQPVVQNYSFEDYSPAIGELDKDTNQIIGWQFENVRAYKVAGTYSQWGEVYTGVGPYAYSDRFASVNFAEASASKGTVGYSSAFLCGVIRTAEEEKDPIIGAIILNAAHYYTRTMGAITQKKIFVYADVTYKLNVDFMYQINASSQDIEFVISRSDASPSLKLTGKTYKSDGTEQNVNNGTQISRYISTRSLNRENSWNLVELEFTPSQDGYIDLRFTKTDIGSGADRDGTGTWIDNVRIIPVKY